MRGVQLTKEMLEELYWNQGLSVSKIGNLLGYHGTNIHLWMKKFGIKRRPEYKKHLKIQKEILENFYWKKGLSLEEIGKMFNCQNSNIFYWMRKYKMRTKPVGYNEIKIPREVLEDMYLKQKLSTLEMEKKLGIDSRLIRKKLKKAGIPMRSLSEAGTKKFKKPFSGSLEDKAYFLGLRTGDFYAKMQHLSVRMQTTSTHPAQIKLLRNAVKKYGETHTYLSKSKVRQDEWFIYADLDKSFDFLLKKPQEIPKWILEDENLFYTFLCAYSDCEGTFNVVKSHERFVRFIFRLKTGDKRVLEQIKAKLEEIGYSPRFYYYPRKGLKGMYGPFNTDIHDLTLYRKREVLYLINKMLPLSKHPEKINKMRYIQENQEVNHWLTIMPGWKKIERKISAGLLKTAPTKLVE